MHKINNTLIISLLLALLATGCKKDNSRIRISAEKMRFDSKVLIDPTNINNTTWITGETIDINGSTYYISNQGSNFYLINDDPISGNLYAIYPGTSFGGNDIDISNSASGNGTVVLKRLTVNFLSNGKHEVVFPMAASAPEGSTQLLFHHLTGGLKISLASAQPFELASVKVVAQCNTAVSHLGLSDLASCRWAVQGPTVPTGNIGITGDLDVAYVSEMNFDFTSTSNGTTVNGVSVTSSGITFCAPITINKVQYITFVGYSSTGEELFRKTKDLGGEQTIQPNIMYTIPNININ